MEIKIQTDFNNMMFDNVEEAIEFLKEFGGIKDEVKTLTYDCQDMPKDIRREFFDYHDAGNDCHVTHYIEDEDNIVDKYLMDELDCSIGSDVIVAHWW